jgi:hypothetical protein
MKIRKLTILHLTLLITLVLSVIAITASAKKPAKLKVKWRPPDYLLDNMPPDPWNAEVFFAPPRDLDEINTATILLEGLYTPESAPYPITKTSRLVFPFDGYDVLTAVLLKVGHMMPGQEYRVYLEITGELNDGTPFAGEGGINLIIPETPAP